MTYHLVFDKFPSPEGSRFIELEDSTGHSISAGEWRERKDGYVELVLPAPLSKDNTQTPVTERPERVQKSFDARKHGYGPNTRALFEYIEALEARIRASEPIWQDIATAPRDGTDILLLTHDWGAVQGRWDSQAVDFYDELNGRDGPLGAWVSEWVTKGDVEPRLYCGATPYFWMPLEPEPAEKPWDQSSPPKPLSYEGEQS